MDLQTPAPSKLTPISVLGSVERMVPQREIGPIETKMRATLNTLKGSAYPDTFDWSLYDKIAARFGDKQPRGGVVFNTGLKLLLRSAKA